MGTVLDGIFWIRINRVGIFWIVTILGGNFPGGNCPGGSYPGWEFSGWELSGGNHPGGNFSGGNFPITAYCPVMMIKNF